MNIPNLLTTFRIILVPIYMYIFYNFTSKRLIYGGLIFILAGITDILDGHIARKYSLTTKLGTVLDPLADKLMSFAVLLSFTSAKLIPSWILKVMGLKELFMILGGSILYLFKGNKVLPANKYGKIATASFYVAILSVVFGLSRAISKYLFIITVGLNLLAFLNYLIIFLSIDSGDQELKGI